MENAFTQHEISLQDVLDARERRALRQMEAGMKFGLPLVSFCMNIAGPIKNGPVIRRAFREGLTRLKEALRGAGAKTELETVTDEATGCEALLSVCADAGELKKICVSLEDEDRLGRLFDMDVLLPSGEKLEREAFGFPQRSCLICGREGKSCASRRIHPVPELQRATNDILSGFFSEKDADAIAGCAAKALLYEVCTTPKPGLVDRANNGSHLDMDVFTFLDSTAALLPYLRRCVRLGMENSDTDSDVLFPILRREGLRAERAMFAATKGVNTHKGAVFTMGTLCCAAGQLWCPEAPWAGTDRILSQCASLYGPQAERDFAAMRAGGSESYGGKLYLEQGITGIRGELARGLPSVRDMALPALHKALDAGAGLEQAGTAALLALIANVTDTNLIHRGGPEGQRWAAEAAGRISGPVPSAAELQALDRAMTERGLSPGGCADLLSAAYFLYFGEELNEI